MPTYEQTASKMLCHKWLLECSYILCDADIHGFPIVYASTGFAMMFGTYPVKCLGKKCGAIVGVESIIAKDPTFQSCDDLRKVGPEEVTKAFEHLQRASCDEVKQMLATGTGSFVTVNQTLGGVLVVVSVVMCVLRHKTTGQRYAIGLQEDITDAVTVEDVLRGASQGSAAADERRGAFLSKCQLLLQRPEVRDYLDQAVGDIWCQKVAGPLPARPGARAAPADQVGTRHVIPLPVRVDAPQKPPLAKLEPESGPVCKPELQGLPTSVSCQDFTRSISWKRGWSGLTLPTAWSDDSGHGASNRSANDALHKVTLAGYTLGPAIAHSQLNRAAKLMQAQMGPDNFALKYIDGSPGSYLSEQLQGEYEILRKFTHPNIVRVVSLITAGNSSVVIMEFLQGQSLWKVIRNLQRHESHYVLGRILAAVEHLHSDHLVAHRDLKAENVMVDTKILTQEETSVKLVDFGSARVHGDLVADEWEALGSDHSCTSMASSFHDEIDMRILPPHRHGGRGNDFELDVFSIGLVALGLLLKKEAFTSDVFNSKGRLKLPRTPFSAATKNYVVGSLSLAPAERPKVKDLRRGLVPLGEWSASD